MSAMFEDGSRPAPRCISCGYDLHGLTVEAKCPECATPVWNSLGHTQRFRPARSAMIWGIVALGLFALFAPAAIIAAPVAIVLGRRARRMIIEGKGPVAELGAAKAGIICGWVALGLILGLLALYAVLLLGLGGGFA